MIIDVITYNGEAELFEIRYNILKDFVDEFRVIEFDQTFSGKKKDKKFNQNYPKVKHYFVTKDIWRKYENLAWQSPNTLGAEHWKREFMQKESIKDFLTDLDDENIIYIGDTDEIYESFSNPGNSVFKLKLRVYTYWLNNRSSEQFWGTIVGKYKNIKGKCLNHLRQNDSIKTETEWGWHFTSMGGYDMVKKKLTDSYTKETYAIEYILNNLHDSMRNIKDFLGRDFAYKKEEGEWPKYLQEHKDKYSQLCL